MFQKIMQIEFNIESILSLISGVWTVFFVFVITGYMIGHEIDTPIMLGSLLVFVLGIGFLQIFIALMQRKEIYWVGIPLYFISFILFFIGLGYVLTLLAFISSTISIAKLVRLKFFSERINYE